VELYKNISLAIITKYNQHHILKMLNIPHLRSLKEVGLIAAEDTRYTRKLLTHYDIHTSI